MVSAVDLGRPTAIGPAKSPALGDLGVLFAPARRTMVAAAGEK
jgi:hypothetical protein